MRAAALEPVPEPQGLLSEPPRIPPVAVGVATPPPPADPYSRRHTMVRRIALGLLAVMLAAAAVPLAASTTTGRLAAASGVAAASADVALQATTGSPHPWREVVGPAAWRLVRQAAAWPARFGGTRRSGHEPLQLGATLASEALLDARAPSVRRTRRDKDADRS